MMSDRSLEQLFADFLATGDEQALELLLRRSAPALRRQALRLGASADDADDLVQETVVAAIQGADRYEPGRPLLPWLKGILTFRAARLARETTRRRIGYGHDASDQPGLDAPPIEGAARRELAGDVRAAIAQLPEHYRAPLEQFLLEGESPQAIARQLGTKRATVRVRLHRGLEQLRRRLRRWSGSFAMLLWTRPLRLPLAVVMVTLAIATGVWLAIADFGGGGQRSETTNANAAATAGDAAASPSPAAAVAAAGAPVRTPLLAEAAPTVRLSVAIADADGRPVPCSGVVVEPAGGVDPVLHRRREVSDASGTAQFAALAVGEVAVRCDRGAATTVRSSWTTVRCACRR